MKHAQDKSNEEIGGFKISHSWQHVNPETRTQTVKRERIPLWNARRRIFELLRTKHVLNTMFILEYSLVDLSFERILEEQLKNENNP